MRRPLGHTEGRLWTLAIAVTAFTWFGLVAARAAGDDHNTGMANPIALVHAYDQFAGNAPADVVTLSLSNLRGLSSEALNAGGRVTVNLKTGSVDSVVDLLPGDASFDLWLIDNQAGFRRTTLADNGDSLM